MEDRQQQLELFLRAVYADLLGLAAVQSEHTHEGGGVHLKTVRTHDQIVGLRGSQGHKILNIPERVKAYHEFLHGISPQSCTKFILSCIMGAQSQIDSM